MKVVNRGHDYCVLTEYNGRKYAFYRNIPVEIDPAVYNEIVRSNAVNAQDIKIYEEPIEKPKENIIEKIIKQRGRPKKRSKE